MTINGIGWMSQTREERAEYEERRAGDNGIASRFDPLSGARKTHKWQWLFSLLFS